MRIVIINETSAGDKNSHIVEALQGHGHKIINAGMKKSGGDPELTYIETGFLAALFLNTGTADMVVGGCGTGQGFMLSAMQYPGVFCGLIDSPLDAWLFTQINGGNCISLALNKGYGWGSNENLKFIFEKMFSVEPGSGYPQHRVIAQQQSRKILVDISAVTHLDLADIMKKMNKDIIKKALNFPGVWDSLDVEKLEDSRLKDVLRMFY